MTLNWKYVYQCSDESYEEVRKERAIYYNHIKEEDYKTIDRCVAFALKNGNHAAFAKYFIEKAMSNVKLFSQKLQEYIDASKDIGVQWGSLRLITSACWRSAEFTYTKENIERASYGVPMLSNWKNGVCIPDKDVIIQIGLSLGLDSVKTNELLRLAGHEKMYVLDIVDTIVLYYLDNYCDSKLSPFEKLKHVKEQINIYLEKSSYDDMIGVSTYKKSVVNNKFRADEEKIIKGMIKEISNLHEDKMKISASAFEDVRSFTEHSTHDRNVSDSISCKKTVCSDWDIVENMDFENIPDKLKEKYGIKLYREKVVSEQKLMIGMPQLPENREQARRFLVWNPKQKQWYRYEQKGVKKIGLIHTLDKDIEDTIKNYRDYLEKEEENKRKENNTDYLTVLFDEKLKNSIDSKNLNEFLDSHINNNALRGMYSLRHYGYLKKTIEYLETPRAYIKNIKYSPLQLVVNEKQIFTDKSKEKEIYINASCKRFAADLEKNKPFKNPRETYLRIVNTIWKLENVIDLQNVKDMQEDQKVACSKGKYLKVRMLIEGRNIGVNSSDLEQGNKKNEAYVLDIGSKTNLMKYAVAVGQEEHLGQYLKLAGFWDCDLYSLSSEEIDEHVYDRIDLLMIYAHRYKEELLKVWSEKLDNKSGYKIQMDREFPFIKLLMLINRDIQFVAKEIKHWQKKEKKSSLKESLSNILSDMIYPLKVPEETKWVKGTDLYSYTHSKKDL